MVNTWFWLSVIFFLLSILLMVGYIALGVVIFRFVKEMRPKVDALEKNVQTAIQRVHVVSERVEEVAASVKATVDNVGDKAKGVATSAELVAHTASRQFERFSPILIGALTAIRVVSAIRESRKSKAQKIAEKEAEQASKNSHLGLGKVLGAILRLATK